MQDGLADVMMRPMGVGSFMAVSNFDQVGDGLETTRHIAQTDTAAGLREQGCFKQTLLRYAHQNLHVTRFTLWVDLVLNSGAAATYTNVGFVWNDPVLHDYMVLHKQKLADFRKEVEDPLFDTIVVEFTDMREGHCLRLVCIHPIDISVCINDVCSPY